MCSLARLKTYFLARACTALAAQPVDRLYFNCRKKSSEFMEERGLPKDPANIDLEEIERRFGFVVKLHRIGRMEVRVAQVDRVDDMVREIYPDAVTSHGDAPVWMITWPAAFGLAEYLLLNQRLEGMRVLELGCGTAASGIALERAGAQVMCTDYDPLALSMAQYNAQLNSCCSIETRFLDWYCPNLTGCFDLVVGSEVSYFDKSFRPLLSVLKNYTAPTGRIVLSDQGRPQMELFLRLCMEAGFSCCEHVQMVYLPDQSQSIRITILTPPE
jgi:predicted nicotinamide N-methyase